MGETERTFAMDDALKVCFVGTYPPTRCGLATFTQSLLHAMVDSGVTRSAGVIRVLEAPEPPRYDEVVAEWVATDPTSRDRALATIQPWLMERDIYARGRFGAWRYELGNMDHAVKMGVDIAHRLVEGRAEELWAP